MTEKSAEREQLELEQIRAQTRLTNAQAAQLEKSVK